MSFQLVPKSVTLNDLERRNGLIILRYFTEFGSFRDAHGINFSRFINSRLNKT